MKVLRVEVAKNGFVVFENDSPAQGIMGEMWAFESAATLADFMLEWGEERTKTKIDQDATAGKG